MKKLHRPISIINSFIVATCTLSMILVLGIVGTYGIQLANSTIGQKMLVLRLKTLEIENAIRLQEMEAKYYYELDQYLKRKEAEEKSKERIL